MNILISGRDGVAHALAWKLSMSRRVDTLYCIPGNGGTQALCRNLSPDALKTVDFIRDTAIAYSISAAGVVKGQEPILPPDIIPSQEAAVTVCCLSDGKNWFTLPPVHHMQHNHALWADAGDAETIQACRVPVEDVMNSLRETDNLPVGVIRVLLEPSATGFTVIGTAPGFGMGDAQMLLPILSGDLVGILQNCTEKSLQPDMFLCNGACAGIVLDAPHSDTLFHGMGKLARDVAAFHEHTQKTAQGMTALGGAALTLVTRGENPPALLEKLRKEAVKICFD